MSNARIPDYQALIPVSVDQLLALSRWGSDMAITLFEYSSSGVRPIARCTITADSPDIRPAILNDAMETAMLMVDHIHEITGAIETLEVLLHQHIKTPIQPTQVQRVGLKLIADWATDKSDMFDKIRAMRGGGS